MRTAALIFFIAISPLAMAQNLDSDTISWHVDELNDLKANVTQSYQCDFITYGCERIRWVQSTETNDFLVSACSGILEVTVDGERTLEFSYDNRPARLIFSRSDGDWRIRMEVIENGQNLMPFDFRVITFQKQ